MDSSNINSWLDVWILNFRKNHVLFLQKVRPKWATSAKSWNLAVICVDGNLGRSVHRSPPFSHRWPAEFDWPLLVHFRPAPPQVWEIVGTKQRSMSHKKKRYETTLPETNIAPANGWLENEISFWDDLFSGAMLVSGKVIWWCPLYNFRFNTVTCPPKQPNKKPSKKTSSPWLPWDRFAWWLAPGAVANHKFHQQRVLVLGRVLVSTIINYQRYQLSSNIRIKDLGTTHVLVNYQL